MISTAFAALLCFGANADRAAAQSSTGTQPMPSGAYLAGRQAAFQRDYDVAARYFIKALARDTQNAQLMEGAMISLMATGQVDRALPIAKRLEASAQRSQVGHMVIIADMVKRQDFPALIDRNGAEHGIGPLVDGLIHAWALLADGQARKAIEAFEDLVKTDGYASFAAYHLAMAYAVVGNYEMAEETFAIPGAINNTRRGVMARAEALSQLGKNDEALTALRAAFGTGRDPELKRLMSALEAGETVPFTHVTSATDGLAEAFYTFAAALSGDSDAEYALLYGRMAHALRPDHVDALLLNAEILEGLDQHDLAIKAYKQVPSDHSASHAAELGRAAALRRSDKVDAAVEVLEQLIRRFPDMAIVHQTLGDVLRQQENYTAAITAYNDALALTETGARAEWFLYYARAISHERLDDWPAAEADFRKALELEPDQPLVLNYLGYTMVEKQINLDEALDMIERAVAKNPDRGFIVDSLGWVLYRLGRYADAVGHMERAVELMPVDPVVNDHLGDVYWAVGRKREAEFQWSRALSFVDPDDTDGEAKPERMRRKLEVGLDTVLSEEGAAPLKVANDN